MDDNEILRVLGQIEGKIDGLQKLAERVATLELWQSWLRGVWAGLAAVYLYLYKTTH
jgi:hypothetical protein